MSDKYIGVQLKFSGGIASPIISSNANAGSRRLSILNVVKLLWGFVHGAPYGAGTATIMMQDSLVAASATATPASVQSGDTLTIAGTALTAAQRRATGTLTFATAIAGNTVVINGVTFTGAAGAVTPGQATFSIDTSDTAAAASLTSQVNAYADPRISGVLACRSAAAVCTVYAVTQGTAGNAITLATTGGTITRSAATLANGAAITNNTFDFAGTDVTTGAAIAAAINVSTTAAVKQTSATSSSSTGVVTVTAKVAGPAGNAITFVSSSNTRLAVTGSGFLASGSAGAPVSWSV